MCLYAFQLYNTVVKVTINICLSSCSGEEASGYFKANDAQTTERWCWKKPGAQRRDHHRGRSTVGTEHLLFIDTYCKCYSFIFIQKIKTLEGVTGITKTVAIMHKASTSVIWRQMWTLITSVMSSQLEATLFTWSKQTHWVDNEELTATSYRTDSDVILQRHVYAHIFRFRAVLRVRETVSFSLRVTLTNFISSTPFFSWRRCESHKPDRYLMTK